MVDLRIRCDRCGYWEQLTAEHESGFGFIVEARGVCHHGPRFHDSAPSWWCEYWLSIEALARHHAAMLRQEDDLRGPQ